ncbi:MAG: anti-sigma factor [Rubrivivax sp.]|nr:anti-sigma factor [Rubrivivax sp.]
MTSERISDEQLSAWIDGELPAEAAALVAAWLDEHPDEAARVAAWADDRDALRALFAPVAAEPVPAALRAAVRRRQGLPRWALAASAAGLLVLGGAVGGGLVWQQQQRQMAQLEMKLAAGTAQGWVQRAALAHSVYTIEPRHPVEVKAQEEHLARWLTRRIDVPVKLFDLRSQGFELVGGRLLPDGPGKSAQLMYQDTQGLRVTVYLRKPEQNTDVAFRFEQQGALGMFYWIEEGCGYALVGALPRETLLALAEAIYQQHPAPAAAKGS